jgi:tetratricopeptide (TPR) repeat protein
MVRLSESEVKGPFDRSTMLRLIARGEIHDAAAISKVGDEESFPLRTHPDFVGCFQVGTVEHRVVADLRKRHQEAQRVQHSEKRRRFGTVLGLFGFAVIAPLAIARQRLIVPEAWVDSLTAMYNDVGGAEPPPPPIPGGPLVRSLAARWAGNTDPLPDLAHARALLWSGSRRDALLAVGELERMVAKSPNDVEMLATLAEAYARVWDGRADHAHAMLDLVDRADALDPTSLAAARARAAVAVASGNESVAIRASTRCGGDGDAPDAIDLGCRVLYARSIKDDTILADLEVRYPEAGWVRVVRADTLLDAGRPARALMLARSLTSAMTEDAHAWSLRSRAAAGVGNWDEARRAIDRSLTLQPEQGEQLMLRARIHLMVEKNPARAQAELERIMGAPWFDDYRHHVTVWCLASVAHLAARDYDGALALAEKALTERPYEPTALLYAAKALGELGRRPEAERKLNVLRELDLHGRMAAQLHTWAANVLLDIDKKNAAMEVLGLAKEEAPEWPAVFLEGARLKFAMANPDGAVADILALGHLDLASWRGESPLVDVWYPERDWSDVEKSLSTEVHRQLKYGKDMRSVEGILALVTNRSTAQVLLERAVERDKIAIEERAVYAHGALAQRYMERGNDAKAMKHIDRVLAQDSDLSLFQGLKGHALSRLGNPDGAMKSFERSLGKAKDLVGPARWKAEALARAHRDEEAIETLEEVTVDWPEDLQSQQMLVKLLDSASKRRRR